MTLYQRLALLLVPFARLDVRGTWRLLRAAGVVRDTLWVGAPKIWARGTAHGYLMELDLANHIDRMTYFYGRYEEHDVQLVLNGALRSGDCFVDVGANAGMITLLAADLVGPDGSVLAFEPNPLAMTRLRSSVLANQLSWVTPFELGLSDSPAPLTLRVPSGFTDTGGTLGEVSGRLGEEITEWHTVQVVRGDDVLCGEVSEPLAIKIDVEGFETRVIKGLEKTLGRFKPMLITEVIPYLLRGAGSSVTELSETLARMGYWPFKVDVLGLLRRRKLSLQAVPMPSETPPVNVVWLRPDSPHYERLQPWMRPS